MPNKPAPDGDAMPRPKGEVDPNLEPKKDPWADFEDAPSMTMAADLKRKGRLAIKAVEEGILDVSALPDTLLRLGIKGVDWVGQKVGEKSYEEQAIDAINDWKNGDISREEAEKLAWPAAYLGSPDLRSRLQEFYNKDIDIMPDVEAQTAGERYGSMAVRGAAGAVAGGARLIPGVIAGSAGGIGSEAGGDLTKGTEYETAGRVIGGLVAGVPAAAIASKLTSGERVVASALRNATPDDMAAATQLMARAQAAGTPITSAEALAQVMGGNNQMMAIQRFAENAPDSAPVMQQFMNQRPAGNQAAFTRAADRLAPVTQAPTEIAPVIKRAAEQHIGNTRQAINAQARPYYEAVEQQANVGNTIGAVAPSNVGAITGLLDDPAVQHGIQRARALPANAKLADLPDTDPRVLDAAKKRLDYMAKDAAKNPLATPDMASARFYDDGAQKIARTVTQAYPEYGTALQIGQVGRERILEPTKRAPIGQLAKKETATAQQNVLLPDDPTISSPIQTAEAVQVLRQNGATGAVRDLFRTKLQNVFETSIKSIKGGNEQVRGAQAANILRRSQTQYDSLRAGVEALPDGPEVWRGLEQVIDAFEAQGQRLPGGSATTFNQIIRDELSQGTSMATAPFRGVRAVGGLFKEQIERYALRRNSEQLAKALTHPRGVQMLRDIANAPNAGARLRLMNALLATQWGQKEEKSPAVP